MACSHTWGSGTLLLVAAMSQVTQAFCLQQIADRMAHPDIGEAEGGGGPEGRRRGLLRRSGQRLRAKRCRVVKAAAATAGAPEGTSESEAEDDLVVILEDHTDVMPPKLLAFESSPAPDDLQEKAPIEPQLATLDGLHGSEAADPDGQAMQRNAAISNLCNTRIHMYQLQGSKRAFTRGAARAAETVIRSSLGNSFFRKKLIQLAQAGDKKAKGITTYWSLRSILMNWKEDPPPQHEVARALLNACDAMFRKNMSTQQLQSLIKRYDKIIAILTKNED